MRICLIGILLCTVVGVASAEEKVQPSTQTDARKQIKGESPDADTTDRVLDAAKARLKAGDIAGAKAVLESEQPLSSEASQLLYELSTHWIERGYELKLKGSSAAKSNPTSAPTDSEIASLYVDGVIYGFASGTVWLGGVLDVDSAPLVLLPSLLLAGGTSYAIYDAKRSGKFTRGMPRTISLGLRLGFLEATILTSYVGSKIQNPNAKLLLVSGWAGTTLGAVIGGLVANSRPISPARASLMESTALWGGVFTTMGHHALTNGEPAEEIALTAAAGILGGAVAGAYIGNEQTLTESRVRYLDLGGLAGALVTGALYASFAPDSAPPALANGLIATGIASGWYLAYRMTAEQAPRKHTSAQTFRFLLSPNHEGNLHFATYGVF